MKKLILLALILPLFAHAQGAKMLDIKNGFLQFHLGDSISKYNNQIYVAVEKSPDQNEVRPKANVLHKYFDRVVLVNENGIITEIRLFLRDEGSIKYIDGLMTQEYGQGVELDNPDKNEQGTHLVCTVWAAQRVTVMMMQHNINRDVNGHMTRGRIQSLIFKKTSDEKIDGDLPDGFPL